MKWRRLENYIQDEYGNIVVILPTNPNEAYIQAILKTPRMLQAIGEYIKETDSGSLPARRMYNKFKSITDEIDETEEVV